MPVAISATEAEWADAVAGIALQLTTPGTAQTGHGNISGRFIAEAGVSVGSALYVPAHSTLRVGGSLATSFRTVNGVPFVADGDTLAIQVISTIAGAASVTLPQASTCGGRLYLIMNTSVTGFTVTLSPFLGDTINGLTSYTFNTRYESVLLQSTGTQWVIVARTGHTSGGGSGTVTSVAMTVPAEFSVSGSPITGAGTLAVTKATQNANQIFAGPTTGAAAQPTFRTLVSDDIPNNAANTTGTASNITGTAAIANGGTGQTSATAAFSALSPTTTKGDLIVDNGTDPVRLPVGSNGQVLTADSSVTEGVKWAAAGTTTNVVELWHLGSATYYATLALANAAAVSGDTVKVYGILNENNVALKSGVIYDFEDGGIEYTGAGTDPIFTTTTSVTSYVLGYGRFANRASAGNRQVLYNISNSTIVFTASYVEGRSHTFDIFGSGSAKLYLDVKRAVANLNDTYLISPDGGSVYGKIGSTEGYCLIRAAATSNVELEVGSMTGTFSIAVRTTNSLKGTIIIGSMTSSSGFGNGFISCTGSGADLTVRVLNELLSTGSQQCVSISNGKLRIGGRFRNTGAGINCVEKSGGTLQVLAGSQFLAVSAGKSFYSAAAQDVVFFGNSVANIAADANITTRLGTLTVDATYVT